MSGYDLAKNFDASIGFFWRASHQQIYRELGKLRDKGYVKSEEITQSGKPNRIVHTITDDGRGALNAWSKKPVRMPSINTVRIDQHKTKLSQYHRIKERFYDGKTLNINQQGKLIVLQMGNRERTKYH